MLMLIKVCVSETRLTDYKREKLGGKYEFKNTSQVDGEIEKAFERQ
jgi:hypothetical protein